MKLKRKLNEHVLKLKRKLREQKKEKHKKRTQNILGTSRFGDR